MDLSSSYRALVQKHFPQALIVSDRFHVVRLVLQSFATICQRIDPALKWQRGLPKLLAKNAQNLTPSSLPSAMPTSKNSPLSRTCICSRKTLSLPHDQKQEPQTTEERRYH